jgi:hypothetical protein
MYAGVGRARLRGVCIHVYRARTPARRGARTSARVGRACLPGGGRARL